MIILGIETSCDDTCAAILSDDKILSNVISSQTDLHKEWGGVVPDIAKRAHQERIMPVILMAMKRARVTFDDIDVIAVTQGPGLAIALSVGVNTAKELAIKYNIKLVAVNHVEGHILSNLLKNKNGLPVRFIEFPALCLTVSGGHTKIILINQDDKFTISNSQFPINLKLKISNYKLIYEVVGETLDDAAGEALDKAAKLLGLGYPGGPVLETLSNKYDEQTHRSVPTLLKLPHPLADKKTLDYSFSGLKTSFYYQIKDWPKEKVAANLRGLAFEFQESVFETLLRKYKLAIIRYQPKTILASGGVLANLTLRKKLRKLAKEMKTPLFMPFKKELNTDNAAMIGMVGYIKAKRKEWADPLTLDRDPRVNF